MTARGAVAELDPEAVRGEFTGRVIAPGDAAYDAARTVMYSGPGIGPDLRPALIVRVADVDDVRRAVALATETGLELAVRSGGHSGVAHGSVEDGIVLDVRGLDALEIDEPARSAWAGSGLTAGEYTAQAAKLGLATGFGDTGSVGLGGLVTGGGVGYLVRRDGLAIDSLLAAEVVTADGKVLVVDEANHPDLFWAIRGGGGNFGVVTRFRLRLHALPKAVGGLLLLPATAETVAGFIAASAAAPEALSGIGNVMPCPPMPFLPPEQHGRLVIMAMLCWSGPLDEAEAALAPIRALATPVADMVRPIDYPEMYPPEDPDYHPLAISRTFFMDELGIEAGRTIMAALEASDASMRVAQLRVLGGAYARVPNDATAFAHRDRAIMVNVASFYEGDEDRPRREAWVEDLTAALKGAPGAYVNFVNDEGPARVREAYPGATWDRLVRVKRRYDPDNRFRRNQNVPPDAAGG
jgi:FAD binding domain-containing protein/berberine-like enzyme